MPPERALSTRPDSTWKGVARGAAVRHPAWSLGREGRGPVHQWEADDSWGDVRSGKGDNREGRDFEGKPQDSIDWVWNSQKKCHVTNGWSALSLNYHLPESGGKEEEVAGCEDPCECERRRACHSNAQQHASVVSLNFRRCKIQISVIMHFLFLSECVWTCI